MGNRIRCFKRQPLGVKEYNQNCLGRQYSKRYNVRWFQRVEDNLYIFTLAKHTPGDFSGSIQHQGQRMILKMNREKIPHIYDDSGFLTHEVVFKKYKILKENYSYLKFLHTLNCPRGERAKWRHFQKNKH